MLKVKSEVLTGSNSKVCKAPEFNVMVSLSEAPLAPSEEAVERENGALNLCYNHKIHWNYIHRLLDSQTCVICTGIWTGICSAVTGLGEALADREPTTTTLFIADGGASTTSCSPFNKTTQHRNTASVSELTLYQTCSTIKNVSHQEREVPCDWPLVFWWSTICCGATEASERCSTHRPECPN